MSLMTDRLPPFTGSLRSAYSMLRSTDGGKTWSDPIVVSNRTEFEPGAPFNDKNSLTADPYKKRFVYGTWQLSRMSCRRRQCHSLQFFYSDTFFIRSNDTGQELGAGARRLQDPRRRGPPGGRRHRSRVTPIFGAQNIGHQIVVLPDGRLVNVSQARFSIPGPDFRERVIIRSFDNGETWEQTAKIIPSRRSAALCLLTPSCLNATGGAIGNTTRSAGSIPDIAVNRTNGYMYVVWQNVDPASLHRCLHDRCPRMAAIPGARPMTVGGGDTTVEGGLSFAQLPAVHVADDGTVGVLFFDDRNDVACPDLSLTNEQNPECFTDVGDGKREGGAARPRLVLQDLRSGPQLHWEKRVTQESFDLRQAPIARGYFPGDYVNCTSTDNDFVCAFTRTNNLGLPVGSNPPDDVLGFERRQPPGHGL